MHAVTETRPALERVHPPDALLRAVNPLMRRLIGRGIVGKHLLVLHYTGHKSGRRFDVPAGFLMIDGVVCVLTNSAWRHNFAGGRDIEVTLHGDRRPARAVLVDDPDLVAEVYQGLFQELGARQARRRLGIRLNVDRDPTRQDIRDLVVRSGLSIVQIEPR